MLDFSNIHSHKGAKSLNLLGGLPSPAADPDDIKYIDIGVDNVSAKLPNLKIDDHTIFLSEIFFHSSRS